MNQNSSRSQLFRFLLVGGSTVLIDYLVYAILLDWLPHSPAKTVGFLCGAIYAYQFNRTWTFNAGTADISQLARFSLVYATNMGINVWVNALILSLLPMIFQWRINLAFLVATAISAAFNFLGMKLLVFP